MKKMDYETFAAIFENSPSHGVPIMLEDRRMGLCSHTNETHALVDVYRGNDHDGMLHIPYENIIDVPMLGLVAGLKGVDRSEDMAIPKRVRQGIPDHVLAGSEFARRRGQ